MEERNAPRRLTALRPPLRPLTARSVVLSTLLGSHPPRLPARVLVRVGELFGIAEGTIRVALSRMVAAGDLTQGGGSYRLADRLLERQARQDESRTPTTRPWDGTWEIAVVTLDRRSAAERTALRQAMAALHLAELREGTWMRPANLVREWPAVVTEQCMIIDGRPRADAVRLAADLWDLNGWARTADDLLWALDDAADLAGRFTVAAAIVRHIMADPLLPGELLPAGWPGRDLRLRYEVFERELGAVLRSTSTPGGHL